MHCSVITASERETQNDVKQDSSHPNSKISVLRKKSDCVDVASIVYLF